MTDKIQAVLVTLIPNEDFMEDGNDDFNLAAYLENELENHNIPTTIQPIEADQDALDLCQRAIANLISTRPERVETRTPLIDSYEKGIGDTLDLLCALLDRLRATPSTTK